MSSENETDSEFVKVRSLRSAVGSVLEDIEQRAAGVKEAYDEVASTHGKGPFMLGLDSLYFQHSLISMELRSLREMLRVVSNRQYCEYYNLHQEIDKFLGSTPDLRHLRSKKEYPAYQQLNAKRVYDFASVIELHRDVTRVIGEIEDFAAAKDRELRLDADKLTRGLNIGNLVNSFRFSNAMLLERVRLFRASLRTFHAQHRKYLGRLQGKANLVKGALDEDVKEPRVVVSPPPDSPRSSVASTILPDHLSLLEIGDRCNVVGYESAGTIRFIGCHAQKRGARLGVELDEAAGNNNGTVNGHKYFECAPKKGVLVVPAKIVPKLIPPTSLAEEGNDDRPTSPGKASPELAKGGGSIGVDAGDAEPAEPVTG